MQKSFMTNLGLKANTLKEQGLDFFEAYSNLKKEYKTLLSFKEKFLSFLSFLIFVITLVLAVTLYYALLKIESEMYAYTNFDYGYVILFFVLFALLFLGVLYLAREKIYNFFIFNQTLLKVYNESFLKFYFKYIFLCVFAFLLVSVVLIGFVAYEYALTTNASFGYSFSLVLMEIFD